MKTGDVTESEAAGVTYSTTLDGFVDCPVQLSWDNCAKLDVVSSGGTDIVTGTYWAINDFNIVAMDWDGDDVGTWRLSNHTTVE